MKRLVPLLLLLMTISAGAQNYSCFQPDTVQYYTNSNGYVRGIRIDSIHTVAGDIIFYPFKTVRGYYETMVPLDSNGGSWMGSKVIQRPDGITLFDNYWGDTVMVNTQAAPGDQWIFYQHGTSPYFYRAEVTAWDTMSFLGYTDSIKKITITSFNLQNVNYADSLNGFELILSKHHGFVQTFDLYMFPYHPHDSSYSYGRDVFIDHIVQSSYPFPSIPRKGNSIFGLSDYNFNNSQEQQNWSVDDVYEYSMYFMTDPFSQFPPSYVLDTIIQVYFQGSTPKYVTNGWQANFYLSNYMFYAYNYSFHNNDTSINQCFLCPNVLASPMPEEKWQKLFWYYYPRDTSYCLETPLYTFNSTHIMYEGMMVNTFEPDDFIVSYKGSLGVTYVKAGYGGTVSYSQRKLIYYDRGGSICGHVSMPVNTNEVLLAKAEVKVYPNPTSDELTIDIPASEYNIRLLDMLGQIVYLKEGCSDKQLIDVSSFSSGFYNIQIQLQGEPVLNKKVMIQH